MKNKRWLVYALIAAAMVFAAGFLFKKNSAPERIKNGGAVSAANLLNRAKEARLSGALHAERDIYRQLVSDFPNSADAAKWQDKAQELNIKILFSPLQTPNSIVYEVKSGDTIAKIAREFKTTVDLIMKSNNLSTDKIFPGQKLKVYNAPFSMLVDKSQNTLIVKSNEEIVKTYIVSTGANNSTPVGNFKITDKLVNPTWYRAGAVVPPDSPENILGSRWLGINLPSYGIHGTTEPQSLGKQVTQGCVRMANYDVEELYVYIPFGTEVIIVD